MARKRKAAVSRTPVTTSSLLPRALGDTEYRGGVRRPNIVMGTVDQDKTHMARIASGSGLVGAPQTRQGAAGARTAGMLIDNVQTSRAFLSGYALEAYRTSFANGLNNRSGTYDVPGYFVQMNQLNGGILYWPVTLAEKYQWFRYWARCIYLDDKHLGNILMADGTEKDIRKIVQGDDVVTGLGTIRSVKNTFQRLCEDNAYSVEAVGCQPIKTTHHHPFYILRREAIYQNWDTKDYHRCKEIKFKPEWIHAEQLRIGDHILRPMNPQLGGTGLVLGNLAAFLGFYCAEGNLIDSCGSHKIQLTVNSSEVAYTQGLMAVAIASSGNKVRTRKADGDGWKIFGSSKEAFALCDRHVGRGSTTKRLSSEIMSLPRANALEFLGAYFNGDGSRTADRFSNRGELVASTASPYLASQIQTLCLKHGMVCRKGGPHERNNNEFGDGPFWHLTIPRKYAKALIGFSKWAATPEPQFETGGGSFVISGYLASKITAISSEVTKDTVYNLEVDAEGDEKSYVCNGMVTHNTDPYVGRALDLLTDLPMSKLTLNMPKMPGKEKLRQEILDFYQYQIEKIGLEEVCLNILYERNVIGNCFVFHEYNEETMMWERVVMLPPEEVYVFQLPFSDHKRVEYRPERLMALLKSDGKEMILGQSGLSEDIVKHIPEEIAEMVRKEGCIVMDSDPMTGSFVSHIARRKHPYMDLGASILERVLIPLLQNENYRYTQLSLANRNMTPKNLITAVGLLQEELDGLRVQVDLSYLDPDYSIITNYEVNWQQIGAQDRILNLDSEHERIENQIFAAMGVTRELLTGEGSYSGNKITVEILNTMFLQEREVLKNYIERQLFMPLAERHGWFEVGAFGAKKYFYPQISFNRLTIRDNNEVFESLFQLYQKGSLNVDIIYELFNLNGDEIREKLLADAFTVKDPTFNRLLEEVHAEVGRNFSQTTNVLEEIVKGLGRGLKIVNPPNAPQGAGGAPAAAPGGFGEGFGEIPAEDAGEPLALFPDETSVPAGAQGSQGPAKPTVDEVADAVAESLPPGANEQDIKDVVDGLQSGPGVDDVADAVAESLPPKADEKDVKDVVDKLQPRRSKKPTLQDVADAVAENIPPTATDAEIFDIVDEVTGTKRPKRS